MMAATRTAVIFLKSFMLFLLFCLADSRLHRKYDGISMQAVPIPIIGFAGDTGG
jgi:hypothetical protein